MQVSFSQELLLGHLPARPQTWVLSDVFTATSLVPSLGFANILLSPELVCSDDRNNGVTGSDGLQGLTDKYPTRGMLRLFPVGLAPAAYFLTRAPEEGGGAQIRSEVSY